MDGYCKIEAFRGNFHIIVQRRIFLCFSFSSSPVFSSHFSSFPTYRTHPAQMNEWALRSDRVYVEGFI